MNLEEALKVLAATKQDDQMPEFFQGGDCDDDWDEQDGDVLEVTEEELLRFLDEQLPPLVVRIML